MTTVQYTWKRFWCPREGTFSLIDGGFLLDPEGEWGKYHTTDVVSYDEILGIQCLAFIGEPGTGKSTALKHEHLRRANEIEKQGDKTMFLDLRSFGSEERLVKKLFESNDFTEWVDGDYKLHLFLDSLDEGLLRIDTIATLLVDELAKFPVKRLFLRIACRTGDWPNVLENGLIELLGEEHVRVYELVPLRRSDVRQAVISQGLNESCFFEELYKREAVSLAIKPVTLNLLINVFRESGQLPSTQQELYLKGCSLLCSEISDNRLRSSKMLGALTRTQRFLVAARIAAVTIFSNRYAVWRAPDLGNVPEVDVTMDALSGGVEIAEGNIFEVTEFAIQEVLSTGLFNSRGANRFGWAHQTYAEFLAAYYVTTRNMETKQIMSLLTHPTDPERRLIPQLHQTAAWIANLNPIMIQGILVSDPVVLLNADVLNFDDRTKELLTEALLKEAEKKTIIDTELRSFYRKLQHPKLAEQLRPYFNDSSKGWLARRIAVDIAEACVIVELKQDLIDTVIDLTESQNHRENAAHALCRFVDEQTIPIFKLMISGKTGDDPNDQLKGYGFRSLWPNHISKDELFSLLTQPKKRNYIGAYKMFLKYEIIEKLEPKDLPIALNWLRENGKGFLHLSEFDHLEEGILEKALQNIMDAKVLEEYWNTLVTLSSKRRFSNSFIRRLHLENDGNKNLIQYALSMENQTTSLQILSSTGLIKSSDLPWLLEMMKNNHDTPLGRKYAQLAWDIFAGSDQIELIFDAYVKYPIMKDIVGDFFKPVDLYSEKAKSLRESYRDEQDLECEDKVENLDPPPSVKVLRMLDEIESGKIESWWYLNLVMSVEEESPHYSNEDEVDLTKLPGWVNADTPTHSRIVDAAKKYVLTQCEDTDQWLGQKIIYRPATAGYRALFLLYLIDSKFVNTLPSGVWRNWASIILSYQGSGEDEDKPAVQKLVSFAYEHAPEEFFKTLQIMIEKETEKNEHVYFLERLTGCLDQRLGNFLLSFIQDRPQMSPKCMESILDFLINNKINSVRDILQDIDSRHSDDPADAEKAVIVKRLLLVGVLTTETPRELFSLLEGDLEFAKKVMLQISEDLRRFELIRHLEEDQVAVLYVWLANVFPHSEDPIHDNSTMAHFVGPRENVADYRDGILNYLKQRGTYQACEVICAIMDELPHLEWLTWSLIEARKVARQQTWNPPTSKDILELARHSENRLVQNGDDLLEVLCDTLKKIESKFQGETPIAFTLWNETKKGQYKPKDEEEFSDLIKHHLGEDLRNRGVVVNREVEIRSGYGTGKGERTDIQVDAIMRNPQSREYDNITVIIEVKGCWNKELKTAIENQLVGRYLQDNQTNHGLYLVGWFVCDQWTDEDYRKKQTPKSTLAEAQDLFETQAIASLKSGKHVKTFVMNTALR
ncbi:hypothetical protein JJB07_14500 [Tumebacillus sp. ITR2]|uniref:ATP-binding protein n=1 Tax=Tumebacillus amylolyticus TaxID=2801339 RepID=A0ABS1JC51_9BACL|nr:hypothetical protein [Tumebacillus amylolyticus]MBL0387848.1 hypothetical protein [Tumebacillus amylolyticus]